MSKEKKGLMIFGMVVSFLCLLPSLAQAQTDIFELKIPIMLLGGAPGALEQMPVELSDENGNGVWYGVVDNLGYVSFRYVPRGENLELTLRPSYPPPPGESASYTSSGLCDESFSIRVDDPASDCSLYNAGTFPGTDDICELATVNPSSPPASEQITFQVLFDPSAASSQIAPLAAAGPLQGAEINIGSLGENSTFFSQVITDSSGTALVNACGNLVPGERLFVNVEPSDPRIFPYFAEIPVADPISATNSTLVLKHAANATLTLSLVHDGSPFPVPSGEDWSDISCCQVPENGAGIVENLPCSFVRLEAGESSGTLPVVGGQSSAPKKWGCRFNSENYESNNLEIPLFENTDTTASLEILDLLPFQVTLQDDQGSPVAIPVFVHIVHSNSSGNAQTFHGDSRNMGAGVNSETFKLINGASYEVYMEPAVDYEDPNVPPAAQTVRDARALNYLFDRTHPVTITVGSDSSFGQVLSYSATLPTTSASVTVTTNPPLYGWADAYCFDPNLPEDPEDPSSYGQVYGAQLAGGSVTLGLPQDGKTCEVSAHPFFDPSDPNNGPKLIALEGRQTFSNVGPDSTLHVAFNFAEPTIFLEIGLELAEQPSAGLQNLHSFCDASFADGRSSWGNSDESGDTSNIEIGFVDKGTAQVFCFAHFGDPNAVESGEFFESFFTYNLKSGRQSITTQLKKFSDAYVFETTFQNLQEVTIPLPSGGIRITAQTFGDNGSTTFRVSNTDDEARKARPTGQLAYIDANLNFQFVDGEGKEVQPRKPVTLWFDRDPSKLEEKGASRRNVVISHYNPNTGTWEEEPTSISENEDGTLRFTAQVSRFSVWNSLLDLAKKGDPNIEGVKAKATSKNSKSNKVNFQISCSNDTPGIYGMRIRTLGKSKAKGKKDSKDSDPWNKSKEKTADSCEFNMKLLRGKKYEYQLRRNNEDWSSAKRVKVKMK